MKLRVLFLLLVGMTASYAQNGKKAVAAPATTTAPKEGIFAEMETSKGKITLLLDYQKTPVTVANFVSLAEGTNTMVSAQYKGKPFYDGLKFHRVIADFMIQGGDPLGNGSGDPGYKFKDEFTDAKFDKGGILAMANSGPATNGSQFFITHKETAWLNGKHTIFGYVVSGMDVVNSIAQDDVIKKVTIIRKGSDAKKFNAAKIFNDQFAAEAEAKRINELKFASVKSDKVAYLAGIRASSTKTDSGLEYKIIRKGSGVKPADGTPIFIHYAGYLEDGSLFDSSYADVNQAYGKFDAARDSQHGYQPFPFTAGKKDGLIPGFIEALDKMSIGDKAIAFIPSKLGYGEKGAGGVIPPNANIIFEIEMLDAVPGAPATPAPKK